MLSAHVVTSDITIREGATIQQKVNELLAHGYNIQHATLQLECEGWHENLLYCEIKEHSHS